jgi:hypothetical protein
MTFVSCVWLGGCAPRPASNDAIIILNTTLNIIERITNGAPGARCGHAREPTGGAPGQIGWSAVSVPTMMVLGSIVC